MPEEKQRETLTLIAPDAMADDAIRMEAGARSQTMTRQLQAASSAVSFPPSSSPQQKPGAGFTGYFIVYSVVGTPLLFEKISQSWKIHGAVSWCRPSQQTAGYHAPRC